MWLIPLRDLQWRRRRFAIAVVATGLVFALGAAALWRERELRQRDPPHRRLVRRRLPGWSPRGGFGPFTGPTALPALRGTTSAAPRACVRADPVAIVRATTTTPSVRNVNVIGVTAGGVGAPGRAARRSGTRVVDASLGLARGDRLDLNGTSFHVAGVTHGLDVLRRHTERDRRALARRSNSASAASRWRPQSSRRAGRAASRRGSRCSRITTSQVDLERPVHQAKQTIGLIRCCSGPSRPGSSGRSSTCRRWSGSATSPS